LPHLPGLHINEGALAVMFGVYKRILPSIGGFMNEGGIIRFDRVEKMLTELAKLERDQFDEEYADQPRSNKQQNSKGNARIFKKI
jgi:5'-3' exoribonuclease 1